MGRYSGGSDGRLVGGVERRSHIVERVSGSTAVPHLLIGVSSFPTRQAGRGPSLVTRDGVIVAALLLVVVRSRYDEAAIHYTPSSSPAKAPRQLVGLESSATPIRRCGTAVEPDTRSQYGDRRSTPPTRTAIRAAAIAAHVGEQPGHSSRINFMPRGLANSRAASRSMVDRLHRAGVQ